MNQGCKKLCIILIRDIEEGRTAPLEMLRNQTVKEKKSIKKCETVPEIGHLGDTAITQENSDEEEKHLDSDKPGKDGIMENDII